MIGGALVAAMFDLRFDLVGYSLTLGNDFFTAAYGITIKRALNLNIPQTRCEVDSGILATGFTVCFGVSRLSIVDQDDAESVSLYPVGTPV